MHVEIRVFGIQFEPIAYVQVGPHEDLELRAMVPMWWFDLLGGRKG